MLNKDLMHYPDVATEVDIAPAGADVRLRFFSAVTAGDGISILENFRIFMHKRFFVGSIIGPDAGSALASRILEFKVYGEIENPDLEPTSAPSYNAVEFVMSSAILAIENGKVGFFQSPYSKL